MHSDPAEDWTTPYPLPTFVLLLPFALFPPRVAQPLFAATEIAVVLAAVVALSRAILAVPRRDAPLAVAFVAASQPLWVLIAGGNASGFAASFFAFAVATLLSGGPVLAGVLLTGILLKPHLFLVGVPALVAASAVADRRRLLLAAGASAAVLLGVTFALEPGWVGEWLREASRLQDSSASNATGWTIARPLLGDFRPVSAALTLVVVLAFAAWWIRVRPPLALGVAAAMPVSVLIAPHGWSYDYIALLPTLVVAVAFASALPRRPVALVVLALFVVLVPWLLQVLAFQRNAEDLSAWWLVAVEIAILAASSSARLREAFH